MRPITVRDAVPEDSADMAPVMASFGYPEDAEIIRARLVALRAADPTGRVLVAESEGRVVGFMTLHCTPTLHRPTSVGRISALAVLPHLRGSGAGRLLVEAAEEHFASQGLSRIEVTSGPGHAPAYSFYRHLGYEDQGVRFAKVLGTILEKPTESHQ